MSASTPTSKPTPERIFNTLIAFQETEALKAAIELDFFTAIADGAVTTSALAEKAGTSKRGTRILCDFLTIRNFLTKESAVFLNRHSPACLSSMLDFLASPWSRKNFAGLTEAVRKGGTAHTTGD